MNQSNHQRPIEILGATISMVKGMLLWALPLGQPLLLVGQPGVGKTEIVKEVCRQLGYRLIIAHPVVSDPTDFKGFPWLFEIDGKAVAEFVPIGHLKELIDAGEKLVFFLDDIGQAPASVQASLMQLLLERALNGKPISDNVIFVGATNRRSDKAGVSGILEPVKSRFYAILHMIIGLTDWIDWAIQKGLPFDLIAWAKFNGFPEWEATKDITNSMCPRTLANVGHMIQNNLPAQYELHMFSGAIGQENARKFIAFRKLANQLPNVDLIASDPFSVDIPAQDKPDIAWALIGALAHKASKSNLGNLFKFVGRMSKEYQAFFVTYLTKKDIAFTSHPAFTKWVAENPDIVGETK